MTNVPSTESPAGFASLELAPALLELLVSLGYSQPSPIQQQAIPPLLAGRDLIGLAGTGTGKTAAFALPIVHRLAESKDRHRLSTLVLVPTRELAIQVASAMEKYGAAMKVSVLAIYGGQPFRDQVRVLRRGVDVVVATPGRALDHMRKETIDFSKIRTVVLDEADEMLNMGFAEDIEAILTQTPADRQTMLFSATMPPRIAHIAERHLRNPVRIEVARPVLEEGEIPRVRQTAYLVPSGYRVAVLARILGVDNPTAALVFCRTRSEVDELALRLNALGWRSEALHGGMSQEQRDRVMRNFRDGSVTLLIATDVAARGLDIDHLSHVINFHLPPEIESYIHRIGRVGRAGREGVAVTLIDIKEQYRLRYITNETRQPIEIEKVPTISDLVERRQERTREQIRETIRQGGLDELTSLLAPLMVEFNPADVAAAAVKLIAKHESSIDDEEEIPQVPIKPKRDNVAPRNGNGPSDRPRPNAPGGANAAAPRSRHPRSAMTSIVINQGRLAGMSPRDLVGAITNEAGIGRQDIGDIRIMERVTFVEILDEIADFVIETLEGVRIRGKKISANRDRLTVRKPTTTT